MDTDVDGLKPPRDRKTDPDLGMTYRQLLESMERTLSNVAGDLRRVSDETDGLSKAIHDIKVSLAVAAGNAEFAAEQLRPFGLRLTAVEERLGKLESRSLGNGSSHPPAAETGDGE